jgi:DNA-binding response OmpR family regulator
MTRPRNLLVVDDDFQLQRMVKSLAETNGFFVETADNAEDGLRQVLNRAPDLILLDVRLPGMNGFEFCRKLRETKSGRDIPVIFLTSQGEETNRVVGLEMGADDYIVKPFSSPELLARISAVLRRKFPEESEGDVLTAGPLKVDAANRTARLNGKELTLKPKEFDVLCLFLRKKNRVLSRRLIVETVWERDYVDTSRTVDTHVARVRSALGPLRECLQTVEKTGYRWVDLDK